MLLIIVKIGYLLGIALTMVGCAAHRLPVGANRHGCAEPMEVVVQRLDALSLEQREAALKKEILEGNVPEFLRKLSKVTVYGYAPSGKKIKASYYVTSDYLAVGCNRDFFRVPLTPQTGQSIANELHCFLPTKKMVDDIYASAVVKLEPKPITEARERVRTFFEHQVLIEQQRGGRDGLIAGIKKDVVISSAIAKDVRPNRVAIYGWHKLDGNPIQPLYTGHVDWYVDYSHGIRLVYEMIKVDGKWMHYTDVLKDSELKGLLCNEEVCDFYKYH